LSLRAHDHLCLVARAIPTEGIDQCSPQSTARTPSSSPPATMFCARRLLSSVLPLLSGEEDLPASLHAPGYGSCRRACTRPTAGAAAGAGRRGWPERRRERTERRLERGGTGGRSSSRSGRRGRLERPEQQLERGGAGSRRCGAQAAGDVGHERPAMWARATGDVGHARPAKGGFFFFLYFSGEY
jgi:hypothetical protein